MIMLKNFNGSSAKAIFKGKTFPFIPLPEKSKTFFALIGLELDLPPGSYSVSVKKYYPDGRCSTDLTKVSVTQGHFPVEKITVSKEFTSPSPAEQERILKEVNLLKEVYKELLPEWLCKGTFIIPSAGIVTENFGNRRIFNNERHSRHYGIDIKTGFGKSVKASNSGRIDLAQNLYFGGNTVIINHGIGLFSIYCHLEDISVQKGMFVEKGSIIGHSGATGRVNGPHLHWACKFYDQYVNPLSLISLPLN